jgi:cell wall-associated NlpC family hydrolase
VRKGPPNIVEQALLRSTSPQAAATPEAPRYAANLPARGGLVMNGKVGPIDLIPGKSLPEPTPETSAVSEADRVLLARLDADLAQAQKRLNRAETRLTDGQRQLGAFTGVLQSAILEAGDDARGLHPFVRVAQRYLGTPYVWGGESARGFDCSGFIMRVMRDLGYKALPHSAAEQFNYGTPIAKGLLKPGDVVFFANTYKPGISHVGIYLGKSRFIHAANSHVGTIVSSLNEAKWIEKYAGARRLIRVNS